MYVLLGVRVYVMGGSGWGVCEGVLASLYIILLKNYNFVILLT